MEWIFVMFMNGWLIDVDRFGTQADCADKVRIYNAAAHQANGRYLVWCEQRPIKRAKNHYVAPV